MARWTSASPETTALAAQLLDTNKKFHSFRKEEVASMKREEKSLMPSNYGQKLTTAEQTDVLAYLVSLKG